MQIFLDIGMVLLTIAVIPQIWRTIKNMRGIKDIDFKFAFLTMSGNLFAMIWGIYHFQWSLFLLNLMYFLWTGFAMICIVRNRN